MKTVILNILCEGQTEEGFVREVLKPHLKGRGIVVKCRLLVTSKKKGAKGGLFRYSQVKGDLLKWAKEASSKRGECHFFTTMFDFYALPNDFPGREEAKAVMDVYGQVRTIEEKFDGDMGLEGFIPYIQLHEFEALLFSDIDKLKEDYPESVKEIDGLKSVLSKFHDNPELINSKPETAPSKRIIKAIEGKNLYSYNKPKSGAGVSGKIGIETLMRKCTHFREWVEKLQKIVCST